MSFSTLQLQSPQITITCIYIYTVALVASKRLRKIRKGKDKTISEKKESYWKRRIENNIKKWRQDLSKMTEVLYCRIKLGEEERERMDTVGVMD